MLNMKFSPCGSRICIIKILSYKDKNPAGVIQNPNLEADVSFDSLTQMFFAMDALFDDIGNPRRALAPRGLAKDQSWKTGTSAEGGAKPLATFRVDVMFRQNASWQGNLVWLDCKEEAQFRSALELIMIMDGALRGESISAAK